MLRQQTRTRIHEAIGGQNLTLGEAFIYMCPKKASVSEAMAREALNDQSLFRISKITTYDDAESGRIGVRSSSNLNKPILLQFNAFADCTRVVRTIRT